MLPEMVSRKSDVENTGNEKLIVYANDLAFYQ